MVVISKLDYFQILSVGIVVSIILGKAVYFLAFRNINPFVIGHGKRGFLLAIELIACAGMGVWMTEVLLRAFHCRFHIFPSPFYSKLFDSFPTQVCGMVMITLGLVLLILAYISFGDSWRVGFDTKLPGALVTTGVFAVSRNPIYLFLDLWFVGIFLITGKLIFLIFALAALLVLHCQIHQEERFLLELYGQPYQEYCERAGRYFVW